MKKKKEKPVTETKKIGLFDPETGRIKPFVTTPEDSDKAFEELVIKPLLHDKELVQNILSLPDKDSEIRELLPKKDADVPDDEFFSMLKMGGHRILNLPFAKQKMERWQKEKYSEDEDVAWKAQNNQKAIGVYLSYKGHNREAVDPRVIAMYRDAYYIVLHEKGFRKMKNVANARMSLREILRQFSLKRLPEGIDIDRRAFEMFLDILIEDIVKGIGKIYNNEKELANHIVAKIRGITISTLRNYVKKTTSIQLSENSLPVYINK